MINLVSYSEERKQTENFVNWELRMVFEHKKKGLKESRRELRNVTFLSFISRARKE